MEILVIFTCFNRKDKTEQCIKTLVMHNPNCKFHFIVADDNSTDGTDKVLEKIKQENGIDITVLRGEGNLYYSGGMQLAMKYALEIEDSLYDYLLIINDDVVFSENCVEKLAAQSREQQGAIIVGAMHGDNGELTYSAVKYIKGTKYRLMEIEEWENEADTFNANCVLIPYDAFLKVGAIDDHYTHSLGDYDYGLDYKRNGYKIYVSREYAGLCNVNPIDGTWRDRSLSRIERIRRKEDIKGAPAKQWFYFLKKNFGLPAAIKGSITPYIRILLGK